MWSFVLSLLLVFAILTKFGFKPLIPNDLCLACVGLAVFDQTKVDIEQEVLVVLELLLVLFHVVEELVYKFTIGLYFVVGELGLLLEDLLDHIELLQLNSGLQLVLEEFHLYLLVFGLFLLEL